MAAEGKESLGDRIMENVRFLRELRGRRGVEVDIDKREQIDLKIKMAVGEGQRLDRARKMQLRAENLPTISAEQRALIGINYIGKLMISADVSESESGLKLASTQGLDSCLCMTMYFSDESRKIGVLAHIAADHLKLREDPRYSDGLIQAAARIEKLIISMMVLLSPPYTVKLSYDSGQVNKDLLSAVEGTLTKKEIVISKGVITNRGAAAFFLRLQDGAVESYREMDYTLTLPQAGFELFKINDDGSLSPVAASVDTFEGASASGGGGSGGDSSATEVVSVSVAAALADATSGGVATLFYAAPAKEVDEEGADTIPVAAAASSDV